MLSLIKSAIIGTEHCYAMERLHTSHVELVWTTKEYASEYPNIAKAQYMAKYWDLTDFEIVPARHDVKTWYFTFGGSHPLSNRHVRVDVPLDFEFPYFEIGHDQRSPYHIARLVMFEIFGNRWCGQYDEEPSHGSVEIMHLAYTTLLNHTTWRAI